MDYKDKMDGWDVIDERFELGWKSHVSCNLIRVRWTGMLSRKNESLMFVSHM